MGHGNDFALMFFNLNQ